ASNSPTTIALSGAGVQAQLAVTPTSASFGNVVIGTSNSQTFTLTNGGGASVTISQANVTGIGFSLSGLTTPLTLAAGNRATFNAVFTPTTATGSTGSISLVSNAPNSPLGINLSGTGGTATLLLAASPTSLSFGNVNTGSSSSLKATLTNSGNSNVTISSVNASGAGYSASGVNANTTLTPGQTATVNVTFAPTAGGSASGSVSVASNASNSPATISLSGTGVAQSTSSGAPICGKSGDSSNHIPTDWNTFTPPAKGQSYVDPTFGCTVTRITDASRDVWTGSFYLPLNMGYATVSPFNANDTWLMLADGWQRYFITDLSGNIVVPEGNMPAMNQTWVMWDGSNPSVFYYTHGNSMMKGTISGSTVSGSMIHQFTEYSVINFMAETDVSQDGAHVVIISGDTSGSSPENVFDYNFAANTKGPVYTTSCVGSVGVLENNCLHKLIQTPDNNVIIEFASDGTGPEQGNRLWDGTNPLPHLQDLTNHLDAGYDLNGNAVFIESGNSYYTSGLSNPCPSGWGLDVRQIYNTSSSVCLLDNPPAWHVGYRGNAQRPWVGLSFFDGRSPSPEWFDNNGSYTAPTSGTWLLYEDEIIVARIDANNNSSNVYRVARAYSRSNEDFYSQPHAAISRDGRYLAFNSNMAYAHSGCPANFQMTTNCTDVYIVKVN
ncbi:MAG TPA: choice-of-anchor D domain-containing protein, partial [Terriglobales bacterium]|nr:choice-of-anchor D domain-containing protein [Terriglobales bacterium]